ncbi:hypothetical protein JNJ66_04255 [Candidatus Saccharibacteria bacterium]|nr:hypothetical protein [Candidatus Saccharibacteria bacterium]
MQKITASAIESLAKQQETPVVTIYLPTHPNSSPAGIQEDQTRFKNLLREFERHCREDGQAGFGEQLCQRLAGLLDTTDIWQQAGETMAIFATPEKIEVYHLPIICDEKVAVGDSFDVAPLLILKEINQPYYLLALAMHDPKLFRGDLYGLEPVDIGLPASPEAALNIDEMFSNSNTIRGVATAGGGNDMLSSHGQGDSNHAGQEERLKYFRIIDGKLMDGTKIDQTLPMLIAATESEASDFRANSKMNQLMRAYLPGNHTSDTLPDLHALSWRLVKEEIIDARMHDMTERLQELRGLRKSSSDMADIKEAAGTGRVDCLLVGVLDETADSVDDTSRRALIIRKLDEKYGALLRSVIEHGGTVLGLKRQLMPEGVRVAAIYRF